MTFWVGKEEYGGVTAPTGDDSETAPHWRLEAIAETERPRSLTVSADGRRALFVQDRDTSDVWLVELAAPGAAPVRVTTGRQPLPYWEDATPQLSPDGATVAYVDDGHVWLTAADGGPPRRSVTAADVAWGGPKWLSDERLVVPVEEEEKGYTQYYVVEVGTGTARRLALDHGQLDALGDETEAVVAPDGGSIAFTFTPRADLNRSEIRVVDAETGAVRALTGTPRMHDREPAWSPDGSRVAYSSERSGWYELHVVDADGAGDRQLTADGADFTEVDWHPDGTGLVAVRGRRGRFDLVGVDAENGVVETLAPGGCWGSPQWTAGGEVVAMYEDAVTAPQLRLVRPGARPRTIHAPTPLAVRAAPHVAPQEVSYRSFDGLEIPAFLFRPSSASAASPAPAVVYPHGGPTSLYCDDWDGHAQYFLDKGYAWLAPNFRGSTGYGREYERANHGVWGVDDTKDCLAAADYLRTLDWVDGSRLGIFGASYGSYMALLCVTDDPEYRFRCAVSKYGDCNIETSWAQGDRAGVLDLERMMGGPSEAPDAYRAGSPVHRLESVRVPILVAHGERDRRVDPKQSEELVAELRRLGKTYEYVTYPTEAHGFLRAGPQVDFYLRLERFLDRYLR